MGTGAAIDTPAASRLDVISQTSLLVVLSLWRVARVGVCRAREQDGVGYIDKQNFNNTHICAPHRTVLGANAHRLTGAVPRHNDLLRVAAVVVLPGAEST